MTETISQAGRPDERRKRYSFRYVKLVVLSSQEAVEVEKEVCQGVSGKAHTRTAAYSGYNGLKNIVAGHERHIIQPEKAGKINLGYTS